MNRITFIKAASIAFILITGIVLVVVHADKIDGNDTINGIKAQERAGKGVC